MPHTIYFFFSFLLFLYTNKYLLINIIIIIHTIKTHTITIYNNPSYPKTITKKKKELWRRSRLRQVKYLNNIVEQDHRRVKRLTGPGLGFGGFWTARRTLAGYEAMAMIRKGQVRNIGGNDIRAQAAFIAGLFQVAA